MDSSKEFQIGFADNIDVNARDPKGRTALILAIQHGQLDAVKALLAHGANASLPDSHGATPMGAAHERGNFEITRALERATRH
jgi:ankyrin repeat protein